MTPHFWLILFASPHLYIVPELLEGPHEAPGFYACPNASLGAGKC